MLHFVRNNYLISIIHKAKNNKVFYNGLWFSIFSFINRGISFVLLIILAKFILPDDFGRLSLYNTIVQFLSYFVALSTSGFFSISYFKRKGELFRQDFTSIIVILHICTLVIVALIALCSGYVVQLTGLDEIFIWIALLCSFLQVWVYLFTDYFRVREELKKYGLISCGFAIANFVVSLFLVVHMSYGWAGRVYAQSICLLIFSAFAVVFFISKHLFLKKISLNGMKMIVLWGLPLIPHEATTWLKQGCDRLIINGSHTLTEVGLFSFALSLTGVIIMIGSAFNASNSVSIYKILSSNDTNETKTRLLSNLSKNMLGVYTLGYLICLVVFTLIIPIVLPQYKESLPYFWLTSLYGYFQCIYFIYINYLFYYQQNKHIMHVTFLTALLHLVLSVILTRYSLYYTCAIYIAVQLLMLKLIKKKSLAILHSNSGIKLNTCYGI